MTCRRHTGRIARLLAWAIVFMLSVGQPLEMHLSAQVTQTMPPSNGSESSTASAAMFQILAVVKDALWAEHEKNPLCRRAAVQLASEVIADAYYWAPTAAFLNAIKSAISNILSLGSNGLKKYLEEKAEAAGEALQERIENYIKEQVAGKAPDEFLTTTTKNKCRVTIRGKWDIAAGTYDVWVSGECDCTPQLVMGAQPTKLKSFFVHMRGRVKINIDHRDFSPSLTVGYPTERTIQADCNCTPANGNTQQPPQVAPQPPSTTPQPQTPGTHTPPVTPGPAVSPVPPVTPGGPVPPAPPVPPVTPPAPVPPPSGGSTVCSECQVHVDAVNELKRELAAADAALESAKAKLAANRAAQAATQDAIDRKEAQLAVPAKADVGGFGYDPTTGITREAWAQPDGTVKVTVKDANGNIIEEYTRPSADLSKTGPQLEKDRATLADLKKAEKTLQDDVQKATEKRARIASRLEDAEKQLKDCIEQYCNRRTSRLINEIPGVKDGALNLVFQNVVVEGRNAVMAQAQPPAISPRSAMSAARALMEGLFARPSFASYRRPGFGGRNATAFQNRNGGIASRLSRVVVSVIATGRSTGDVFQIQAVDEDGAPVPIEIPDGLVMQPIKQVASVALQKLQATNGAASVSGYCLDFAKLPPSAGTLYRVADDAVQQRFASMRAVLQAARSLEAAGKLHPDSDAAAYVTSLKQWAVWAKLEKWDVAAFEEHFVEHTRKGVEGNKVSWTKALDQRVRQLVPNRWNDVRSIWAEAERVSAAQ